MTKYRIETFYPVGVKAIEVTKETEHCVWYVGYGSTPTRHAKDGLIFDTWCGAHARLEAIMESKLRAAQSQLDRAKNDLATVRAMKEPR